MTNLFLTAIIWWHTNYLDSAVDSRGDGKFRTNIVSTVYATPLPEGWVTNSVVKTNVSVMKLKWVEVGRWSEATRPRPDLPPVPPTLYTGTNPYVIRELTNGPHQQPFLKVSAASPPANPSNSIRLFRSEIGLEWDQDTNSIPDVFKLYTATNLNTPITNWTLVAEISGNVYKAAITNIALQQSFFLLTASNWWGESLPSNVAGTPPIPSDEINLRIGP